MFQSDFSCQGSLFVSEASNNVIGSVYSQKYGGHERVIEFYNKILTKPTEIIAS